MNRLTPPLSCALIIACVVAGCATAPSKLALPAAMTLGNHKPDDAAAPKTAAPDAPLGLKERTIPTPSSEGQRTMADLGAGDSVPPGLGKAPVSVNLENLPLPAFINVAFGNLLGLNFQIDPDVAKLTELVTLRTAKPQSPSELFLLARQVLGQYGVAVNQEGDLLRMVMAKPGTSIEPPIIFSGRALPDVPVSHRPVFYLLQLDVIRANEAAGWLLSIFGEDIKAEENLMRNALLLSGRSERVQQAVDTLRLFDRPYMRGRVNTRLEPAFLGAEELATRLVDVLTVEGYGASKAFGVPASIFVMPIPTVNAVLVFASSRESLDRAITWARELDRPNPTAGGNSVFYYQIKNTKADDIARVLGASGGGARNAPKASAPGGDQVAQKAAVPAAPANAGFSLTVDAARNALIFQGDPVEWERLLNLIRQMDQPTRQVMVEVTIAEITLSDNEEFGVSWFAKSGLGRFDGNVRMGTLPANSNSSTGGASGLTYLLNLAGESRAQLRALADNQRVSILSTPRLMVKSGEEASIDVGTEIPTIGSQTASTQQTEGNSNILQTIQYRKTGILLNIVPTVYSDDRIDIELSQEVSEALPVGDSSVAGSPSIFNRAVKTSLSLRDGGSILIGGLMSQRETKSNNGVPFLKDAPLLGNLFKSQKKEHSKTELIVMIVPYIIESDDRARQITRAIGEKLEYLDLPTESSALRTEPATDDKPE